MLRAILGPQQRECSVVTGSPFQFERPSALSMVDGPGWKHQQVADVFHCPVKPVEAERRRRVPDGFELALRDKRRRPREYKPLDGEQEARAMAFA